MITFRKIEEKDRELFFELSEEFYNSSAVLAPINPTFHENTFNELMRSRDYLECFIIEYGGETAGFGLLNITYCHEAGGKIVWLEELYIRERFRSCGIGRAYFAYVEKNYPAMRYRLEVEKENERAVKLYKKLGYDFLEYDQMIKDFDAETNSTEKNS